MPTFPFIIQSSETLDQQSMKYVRSHVTRQSMQRRRQLSDLNGQRHLHIPSRPVAVRVRPRTGRPRSFSDDSDEQQRDDERLKALTNRRRRNAERHAERLRPTGQINGTAAEFSSVNLPQRQLKQLLGNYHEFSALYHVYKNDYDNGFSPFSGYLKTVAYHNPVWLTSSSLVAYCKIDTLREHEEVDILTFKALALQNLRKAIKNAKTYNDDITIMSLVAFMAFEVLNAETEEDHMAIEGHFRGIETVVNIRGGEDELSKDPLGLLMVRGILVYHLLYAIISDRNPFRDVGGPPRMRTPTVSFVDEPHYCCSPILKSAATGAPIPDEALPVAVRPFLAELNNGWELLFSEYHSDPGSIDHMTYSTYRSQLQMPSEPIVGSTGIDPNDVLWAKMSKSCHLAGIVFYRAVVNLIPFQDAINEPEIAQLHALLRTVDTSAWTLAPYVLLWIVMVGSAGSINNRQRRFFGTQMSRTGVLFGGRWWAVYCQTLTNFIWLQRVMRGEIVPKEDTTQNPLVELYTHDPNDPTDPTDPSIFDTMPPQWPEDELGPLHLELWRNADHF